MENSNSGGQSSDQSVETEEQPVKLTLVDLRSFHLGDGPDAREATHDEFFHFAASVVGVGMDWPVERRRDFLNWALSEKLIEVDGPILRKIKK
jgi:hypothetical protein